MNKKLLISLLDRSRNANLGTDSIPVSLASNTLILITAAGQITGTVLREKDDKADWKGQFSDMMLLTAAEVVAECQGGDSFILLKDAVVENFGKSISYSYLYVFTDDIIAATIGNMNVD